MRRREFLGVLGGAVAAWPLTVRAQQAGKLPTIGVLGTATPAAQGQWIAAFVKRLREAGQAGQLVDVREDSEFADAHAAGAIHLSKGIIERDIETTFPDKGTRLVLYCGGGYRSALATDNLQKMGYTNILSLDGGWRAIEASGLPLEKG